MTTSVARLDVHIREAFVRPSVREIPITTKIIDQVMPYFPKQCQWLA